MYPPKETYYKTAFSPLFDVYVSIDHAHQDDSGEWIYTCSSFYKEGVNLQNHLFRECELERLCL
jgi:hypothetical protein